MTTTTARELVIDIPCLPPSILLPNRRPCWQAKHRVAQEYSQTVKLCAISARNEWESCYAVSKWPTLPRATLQLIVTYPHVLGHRKIPDPDNLVAALKPAIAALQPEKGEKGKKS